MTPKGSSPEYVAPGPGRTTRAFTSPTDPLQKTGIFQVAGGGNPNWLAKFLAGQVSVFY
jgi:hypothetical protein